MPRFQRAVPPPVFDWPEYLELESRGEALAYLSRGLGTALNYVGPVLDTELPHGFNDHTDRHTLWVSERAVELLQRAGVGYDGQGYFDDLLAGPYAEPAQVPTVGWRTQ